MLQVPRDSRLQNDFRVVYAERDSNPSPPTGPVINRPDPTLGHPLDPEPFNAIRDLDPQMIKQLDKISPPEAYHNGQCSYIKGVDNINRYYALNGMKDWKALAQIDEDYFILGSYKFTLVQKNDSLYILIEGTNSIRRAFAFLIQQFLETKVFKDFEAVKQKWEQKYGAISGMIGHSAAGPLANRVVLKDPRICAFLFNPQEPITHPRIANFCLTNDSISGFPGTLFPGRRLLLPAFEGGVVLISPHLMNSFSILLDEKDWSLLSGFDLPKTTPATSKRSPKPEVPPSQVDVFAEVRGIPGNDNVVRVTPHTTQLPSPMQPPPMFQFFNYRLVQQQGLIVQVGVAVNFNGEFSGQINTGQISGGWDDIVKAWKEIKAWCHWTTLASMQRELFKEINSTQNKYTISYKQFLEASKNFYTKFQEIRNNQDPARAPALMAAARDLAQDAYAKALNAKHWAFSLHKLVCEHRRDEYVNEKLVTDYQRDKLKTLDKQPGVQDGERKHRTDPARNSVFNEHGFANARDLLTKATSIALEDQKSAELDLEFTKAEQNLIHRERNPIAPLDEKEKSNLLGPCLNFGNRLLESIKAKLTQTTDPEALKQLSGYCQNVTSRMNALVRRDARAALIDSHVEQYIAESKKCIQLDTDLTAKNSEALMQRLKHCENLKDTIVKLYRELINDTTDAKIKVQRENNCKIIISHFQGLDRREARLNAVFGKIYDYHEFIDTASLITMNTDEFKDFEKNTDEKRQFLLQLLNELPIDHPARAGLKANIEAAHSFLLEKKQQRDQIQGHTLHKSLLEALAALKSLEETDAVIDQEQLSTAQKRFGETADLFIRHLEEIKHSALAKTKTFKEVVLARGLHFKHIDQKLCLYFDLASKTSKRLASMSSDEITKTLDDINQMQQTINGMVAQLDDQAFQQISKEMLEKYKALKTLAENAPLTSARLKREALTIHSNLRIKAAFQHFDTLHFSEAEKHLLAADQADPANPMIQKGMRQSAMDQYRGMMLLMDVAEYFTRKSGKKHVQWTNKVISLIKMPGLVTRWLPRFTPTHFKELLRVDLKEQESSFDYVLLVYFLAKMVFQENMWTKRIDRCLPLPGIYFSVSKMDFTVPELTLGLPMTLFSAAPLYSRDSRDDRFKLFLNYMTPDVGFGNILFRGRDLISRAVTRVTGLSKRKADTFTLVGIVGFLAYKSFSAYKQSEMDSYLNPIDDAMKKNEWSQASTQLAKALAQGLDRSIYDCYSSFLAAAKLFDHRDQLLAYDLSLIDKALEQVNNSPALDSQRISLMEERLRLIKAVWLNENKKEGVEALKRKPILFEKGIFFLNKYLEVRQDPYFISRPEYKENVKACEKLVQDAQKCQQAIFEEQKGLSPRDAADFNLLIDILPGTKIAELKTLFRGLHQL